MADFARRGAEIYGAVVHASGFRGRAVADRTGDRPAAPSDPWGPYALPLGLPDFAGHDPHVHIATLSLWSDVGAARRFVYRDLHREALGLRYDWFLPGPWPGHVLWSVTDDVVPTWADGTARLEALARDGASTEHFTFGSPWGRQPVGTSP